MRHSKIDLTMNVYTDPKLLDVRGALDVLPARPLDKLKRVKNGEKDTSQGVEKFAPRFAPTPDNSCPTRTEVDKVECCGLKAQIGVSLDDGKRKDPLTT